VIEIEFPDNLDRITAVPASSGQVYKKEIFW
jgi:hypothetical protein